MKEEFKVCPHSALPDKEMVEYRRDGEFFAGIYPHQDGIRVISKHITGVYRDPVAPSAVIIKFV